jgi:hypothetical protein
MKIAQSVHGQTDRTSRPAISINFFFLKKPFQSTRKFTKLTIRYGLIRPKSPFSGITGGPKYLTYEAHAEEAKSFEKKTRIEGRAVESETFDTVPLSAMCFAKIPPGHLQPSHCTVVFFLKLRWQNSNNFVKSWAAAAT